MVTIERKLMLFSKLLHRSVSERFAVEMEELKKEYEVKLKQCRDEVNKEAEEIISKARKKAEAERIELISKIKVGEKREFMAFKEKHFALLMYHLRERIEKFVQSEEYGDYLVSLVQRIQESEELSDAPDIYITNRDFEKYAGKIKDILIKASKAEHSFKTADDSIIGGFIAEDPVLNIRLDYSIKSLLEDNKPYIMHTLFQAIEAGEAGKSDEPDNTDNAGRAGKAGEANGTQ